MNYAMMQIDKRLHQSQADARTTRSSLGLEEAFEHLSRLFLGDTLTRISHINTQEVLVLRIFQNDKDVATRRRIFQGIAQEIEHDARHLLLVGDDMSITRQTIPVEMQTNLLALRCQLEVTRPQLQCLHDVKTVERQVHLSILYLSEIEDASHKLLQGEGIALHHLQQVSGLALDTLIIQEHLHRVGNQCKRRTKFMTDIREEYQARMSQFHHLLVESLHLLVLTRKLFGKLDLDEIISKHQYCRNKDNKKHDDQEDNHQLLVVIV